MKKNNQPPSGETGQARYWKSLATVFSCAAISLGALMLFSCVKEAGDDTLTVGKLAWEAGFEISALFGAAWLHYNRKLPASPEKGSELK